MQKIYKNIQKMCLIEQNKEMTALSGIDDENNFNSELNQLQDSLAEKLMDTTDGLKTGDTWRWIDGEEEENNQFLTDNDIIEEVMA